MGALVKTIAYPFHLFFPNKRFTLPEYSAAIISSKTDYKIRKTIWQTNYTNEVTLPVYCNYLFNRLLSLSYEYQYVSDEKCQEFIKEHASQEYYMAFLELTDGASKADFWRLLVLNHFGGVYMDIDANFVWPLSKIIKKDDTEVFLLNKRHYTNYFIATTKNNPIIEASLHLILDNIQKKKIDGGVYALTGPDVLNQTIGEKTVNYRYYKYTCIQGSFTNEYFQYLDKPQGKWIHAKKEDLLKNDT